MKSLILSIFLLATIGSFAQNTPVVRLKEDSSTLKLSNLKVDVKITGNFATVTYDMKFFNELDEVLEGELAFPLGEGQTVSKFAMDVNGQLREAVVVEKELARVAYESTVRQVIDPGLLEKVEGNNYKARVYPISPNTHKHIVLTYEQELFTTNNVQLFELPLGITEKIDLFQLSIEIIGDKSFPVIKNNPYKELILKQNKTTYKGEIIKKNYSPGLPVIIEIPISTTEDKILSHRDYFYVYKSLKPASRSKSSPKKITILWDASYSLKFGNVEQELQLLKSYITHIGKVEIQFISFSNAIHQNNTFTINKKNWRELEQLIRGVTYDGGTCFNLFENLEINADETLFFTDGLSNLGKLSKFNNSAIYTVNSSVSANHEALDKIATKSGGSYINLVRLSQPIALKILKEEAYQFLGVNHNDAIGEVYPKGKVNVTSGFAFAGRFKNSSTIELLFGYGDEVTERVNIRLKNSTETKMAKRLWAKQKLKFLSKEKAGNKEAIIALAKQYNLISDYTSMLILDRIEDYVRYRIEPPQELKEEYKERLANIEEEDADLQEDIAERKQELMEDYGDILDWYDTIYPKKDVKKAANNSSNNNVQTNVPTNSNSTTTSTTSQPNNATPIDQNSTQTPNNQNPNEPDYSEIYIEDSTMLKITGTVTDSDFGDPLPGVNVVIEGTTQGTVTDLDGKFSINAPNEESQLIFSYVGMQTQTISVGEQSIMDIALGSGELLDEVVVTSLSSKSLKGLSYSVQVVESNSISNINSINQLIPSHSSNVKSLYIVDGIMVKDNPLNSFKQEDIDYIEVLDARKATKIFGEQAANGATIVVTKKGKEENKEAIEELNNKIADKIELKAWNPEVPYIKTLDKESTIENAYKKYLEILNGYSNSLSFYIDVADFFDRKEERELAITVLTNLMEVELDNYELMKALAYKLEYFEQYELAVIVYEKVLELRPEDPQSYRNLALAYEQVGEVQKSFDLLYKFYNGELLHKDIDERFYGIEHIVYVELCRLANKYKQKLQLNKIQLDSLTKMPVDIRVVIDWNHNDTDIDLLN